MEVFLLTIAASFAALLGGYTALRSQKLLGLATFDLLPEIFDIANSEKLNTVWPMVAMTSGFLIFHLFERFLPLHESSEEKYGPHRHPALGVARAAALTGHSFLDGLSIGIAFQVSPQVGIAVALAVIGHRFADGFDTTIFMIFHKNKLPQIKGWLGLVIIMPVAGGLISLVHTFSEKALAIYLGFFAGFILYICASNIIPQAHSQETSRKAFGLTVLGTVFMFIVTRFT
jgi:zinc transporter ZupT